MLHLAVKYLYLKKKKKRLISLNTLLLARNSSKKSAKLEETSVTLLHNMAYFINREGHKAGSRIRRVAPGIRTSILSLLTSE